MAHGSTALAPGNVANPLVRRVLIDLAIMTVIGVVLALVGPFGTYDTPFAQRLVIWLGYAWLGYLLYAPIDAAARRLSPVLELPAWSLRAAGVLLASLPMALAVWVLPYLPNAAPVPDLATTITHYFSVVLIGAIVTVTTTLIRRDESTIAVQPVQKSPIQPAAPAVAPRFLDRLPAHLGTDLLALEMEDHYVRAHTALGSELVLLRMRDAVAELDGIAGEQVHRSWWVARGAVADVRRVGRNVRLVLDNGLEAPVSRANLGPLKDAGWL
ncbi:MAG: LytTR family transcriptional regulator DNA-binding domain-containing protein [Erythrobacter sp.]|nr:MAG: LytTR family transcriptional regulator DNA-binding domain-containing protein [Erythrobacter sp.]